MCLWKTTDPRLSLPSAINNNPPNTQLQPTGVTEDACPFNASTYTGAAFEKAKSSGGSINLQADGNFLKLRMAWTAAAELQGRKHTRYSPSESWFVTYTLGRRGALPAAAFRPFAVPQLPFEQRELEDVPDVFGTPADYIVYETRSQNGVEGTAFASVRVAVPKKSLMQFHLADNVRDAGELMKRGPNPASVLFEFKPREGSRCVHDLAFSATGFYTALDSFVAAKRVISSRTYVARAIIFRLLTMREDGFARDHNQDFIALRDEQTSMSLLDGGATLAHCNMPFHFIGLDSETHQVKVLKYTVEIEGRTTWLEAPLQRVP